MGSYADSYVSKLHSVIKKIRGQLRSERANSKRLRTAVLIITRESELWRSAARLEKAKSFAADAELGKLRARVTELELEVLDLRFRLADANVETITEREVRLVQETSFVRKAHSEARKTRDAAELALLAKKTAAGTSSSGPINVSTVNVSTIAKEGGS